MSIILASNKFLIFVVGLLVFQAAWIALSAQYPLAFDENFHFGVIKLYSQQWGPFFSSTPSGAAAFGALTRDPSYFYHYLMSFPYRLIALFVQNEVHQIITLRFINIGLFSAGLVAFWRLLLGLRLPKKLVNFSLFMLVLVPIVPFLAATINYDNLLFLLLPITLMLAITCGRMLRLQGELPAGRLLLLVIMSLLISLVKFVFLPILLVIFVYLLAIFLRQPHKKRIALTARRSFIALPVKVKVVLLLGLVMASALFLERFAVNIIEYGNVTPPCSKVESVEYCSQYGPWARDQYLAQQAKAQNLKPDPNPINFFVNWAHDLLYRLYFAINYDYATQPPLFIPYRLAFVVGSLGLLFLLVWGRSIFTRQKELLLPLGAGLLYTSALFYINYTDYLKYGERVAVNGRYFIPLLPFIFVFIGLAYGRFFGLIKSSKRVYATSFAVLLAVLLALQGGGILTFIVESSPNWYWQDTAVIRINQAAQKFVSLFILGPH